MKIRMLKISNEKRKNEMLSSMDILALHLGHFEVTGKVTYSTGVPVDSKPEYILLTLGNVENICYLCHVKEHSYKGKTIKFIPEQQEFINNLPDKFRNEKNVSWLIIDSMQRISTEFLDDIHSNEKISDFIKNRANNKKVRGSEHTT